jgi:nucleoside-diphosphate-sugar epimerase
LLQSNPPTVFGDGDQSRDFTYVENVVEANLLAAKAPNVAGEVFNIACGERITINELARVLAVPFGFIALAIKLDSKGPVFFPQPWVGKSFRVRSCLLTFYPPVPHLAI